MALQSILIFGDLHAPYHDERAWSLFLKVGKAFKPHHLISMGDFLDFYSVSSHSKDPRRAFKLAEELMTGNMLMDELDALDAKSKVFIGGNHSDRLRRYLQDKAPELFGIVDVPDLLQLKQRKWAYVPYKQDTRLGKAFFTHDVGTAGRYATHKALDMYQHTIITGHTHRLGYVVEGNCVGEYKMSASFGWLGDVDQIDYMHAAKAKKDWALGFGVGYLNPTTGYVYLTPVPIVKYTCVVNGQLFSA